MDIEQALEITGFLLCTFKADQGDTCASCDKEMNDGDNVESRGQPAWSQGVSQGVSQLD